MENICAMELQGSGPEMSIFVVVIGVVVFAVVII